jgi:flagella basal body P-ring formation protein FlgA
MRTMSAFRCAIFTAALAFVAPLAFAQTATLKSDIVASGPLVVLGDIFDGAGAAASRPIGPAPRAGATATFLPHMASGLDWSAPRDLRVITVRGGENPRSSGAPAGDGPAINGVRRGDLVLLSYTAPGIRVTARTRATTNAAAGQSVRLVNLSSNKAIDAIVVGPGRATANLDHPITE